MKHLKIHPSDNVAVALETTESVPAGHKFALRDIQEGETIIKYGDPIGTATAFIPEGSHVHTHNVRTALTGQHEYTYTPAPAWTPPQDEQRSFMGYLRPDGRAGVRNEIWIIPTVGCVNAPAQQIERAAQKYAGGAIEGIYAYGHPYGCSQLGGDMLNTQKILAGLVRHPNAAGVLVLGLGCENNNIPEFRKVLGEVDETRVKLLVCQDTEDEVEAGVKLIGEIAEAAKEDRRAPLPASMLTVGLKCGGSDGFSGITANPLVGLFSDWLVAQGGRSILTEVPEMFGAEQILMNRCESREVFEKTVSLINDFKQYFLSHNQPVYENPSPGNKAGGITTLEDKSLGCTQKGGHAPVADVLAYGDPVRKNGLSLLQSPGNDLVSSTALAASGAQIVLFTTGRGTPFGCPAPTVKIATNSALFARKGNWMDFNAGQLLDGVSMEELRARFIDYALALASGEERTCAEKNGVREMCIFKNGVTL
ncbi:MAG: altronate dehydratase [Clostridia bacterium]|nr:altronate dehydratase [Clostridia bacterium]